MPRGKKVTRTQIKQMRQLARKYPKKVVAQKVGVGLSTVVKYTKGIKRPKQVVKDRTKYHFTVVCPTCGKLGALVEKIRYVKGKCVGSRFRVDHKVSHYI